MIVSRRAPEDLKKDIIAVEKSLESKAWAQLWTLRITHLQSGKPLAQRFTPGGHSRQASSERRMFPNSSYLGEASAGPVGPLAWGTFHCPSRDPVFLRPAIFGREEPAPEHCCCSTVCCSSHSLLQPGQPGFKCVIHRVWVHTALPLRCQKFFHSLGEGL